MRVSWILMPGILAAPEGMGSARRWNRGKSTWTSSAWASKAAKRSVTAARVRRTVVELSKDFLRPKSLRLLLSASRRRKVENFSYMRITAFLA